LSWGIRVIVFPVEWCGEESKNEGGGKHGEQRFYLFISSHRNSGEVFFVAADLQ